MPRLIFQLGVVCCLLSCTVVHADNLVDRTGLGAEFGLNKLVGGRSDYSNIDQFFTLYGQRGLSERITLELALQYGWVRPGSETRGEAAGWSFSSGGGLYTVMWHPRVGCFYHLKPRSRLSPFGGASLGLLSWSVKDLNGLGGAGLFPDGQTAEGYDTSGAEGSLSGTNLTLGLTLGVQYFVSPSRAFTFGARYRLLAGGDLDNIGYSSKWGPQYVDANSGVVEGFLGFTFYLGSADSDGDGVKNDIDTCPDDAEDFDGFQDWDGCPDGDNDRDGVPDDEDNCPNQPEDRDGFNDEDGCPEPDNDEDGIHDAADGCPDEPEDRDGYADSDGCPDPDNDGDGVLDLADRCPDTPAGSLVDANGCIESQQESPVQIAERQTLDVVEFTNGSARLTDASYPALQQVARLLLANPDVRIEVRGHTDSHGAAEANRDLSHRRAMAVRDALIQFGVSPSRITAVGFGEANPIDTNNTPEGRARNRRIEIFRLDN